MSWRDKWRERRAEEARRELAKREHDLNAWCDEVGALEFDAMVADVERAKKKVARLEGGKRG